MRPTMSVALAGVNEMITWTGLFGYLRMGVDCARRQQGENNQRLIAA